MAVTIPGGPSTTSPNITLSLGTGDVLHLAQQIGALLATVQGAGGLTVTISGSVTPGPGFPQGAPSGNPPSASELVLTNPGALNATIAGNGQPGGWNYYVPIGSSATTLTGSDVAIVNGTVGGTFNVSGNSTVAPNGGDNTVNATGTYLLSFGPGNNFVNANGQGTIATGVGAATVVAVGQGAGNLIESFGTGDLISAVFGPNTVVGLGSNSTVVGGTGELVINIQGVNEIVMPNGASLTGTLGGSNNLIFPGNGPLDVTITGTNDTVVGSSSASTVTASGDDVVFGGSGFLTFIGAGDGTSTILGGAGGSSFVTAGAGGVVYATNVGNSATVVGGSGVSAIFGGAGSSVVYNSSLGGAFLIAGSGNETLNAAGSSVAVTFGGSGGGGNISMVGSGQGDLFFADNGSDTMTGNGGADIYSFIRSNTGGGKDFISDFASDDGMFLTGYDSTKTTFSTSGPLTMTLSDNTSITFLNLTQESQLNGKYMYVKPLV